MQPRRVAVLGGGPGGLYAARLLKLAQPACEVVVHEQGDRETTFGFGVGLAAGTQRKLEAADADTLRDIQAAGRRHDMTMEVGGAVARVRNDNLIGIARTELLDVLQRHAEKAGVQLEYGSRRTADDLDADVVVAADGVGSATREAGDFGTDVETGRGLYLWCGAAFALDDAVFAPVDTEHGTFVTHAYPYSPDRSTFLVETDEATWRAAGFEVPDLDADGTDARSLDHLAAVFAGHLRGHALIGNRTRWTRFRTVRCDRWSDGRIVLLGDAAHTAHFSIGSGTKLAMEDAIALVTALGEEDGAAAAFVRYEAERRPAVERLQELARRSRLWWESFPSRTHLPVERLMVSYMTRAGNVPLDRFAETSPDVVGAALAQYAGAAPVVPDDVTGWVLDHAADPPAVGAAETVVDAVVEDPWGREADAVVAGSTGSGAVRVVGPPDRPALLTRLDLAERLRLEAGAVVTVEGPPELRDDLAAGLVSGRADRVALVAS
ncbi:FAD-dependent monooxygenase [Pseudonocardia sp. KRD-184]|uniref:FAD-dependent monooxygenase n=1 Tax=Pseudonocardia oceani TaxID=2792013 RepID=A0ABS6UGI4_9PSEU|nr:FAD-dependent monooxygenase [Pseudonocardia oceani]MBW0088093.1 FAD-dependent monooxygenase [Pseudonocardia oceani]MBW0094714.1 FAD-dependent monooxygenase [Pseudonocardia oceani]MBW0107312.1 FAD-dependent monooxygenase [Pseudonocardia oceani]MBW0120398.1 FAD-dependent monooxygenase [Pseudonocardia oceani]MBW0131348.1 FAD-dependent monooxygenase [Pseudonocardia oceani]